MKRATSKDPAVVAEYEAFTRNYYAMHPENTINLSIQTVPATDTLQSTIAAIANPSLASILPPKTPVATAAPAK